MGTLVGAWVGAKIAFISILKGRNEYYQKHGEELFTSTDKKETIKELTDCIYIFYNKIKKNNQGMFLNFRVYVVAKYPKYKFLTLEALTKKQGSPS